MSEPIKQQKAIAIKVSDELYGQISEYAKNKSMTVSGFIKFAIEAQINPQKKTPDGVDLDTGEVLNPRTEKTIDLYDQIYTEFMKKKLTQMSLSDYANNWIWESMERTRLYMEKRNGQSQPANNSSTVSGATIPNIHGDVVAFNAFMEDKIDCQTAEDWSKIVKEINANTTMNDKQRSTLLKPR